MRARTTALGEDADVGGVQNRQSALVSNGESQVRHSAKINRELDYVCLWDGSKASRTAAMGAKRSSSARDFSAAFHIS